MDNACILELKDIVKRYPGVLALDHVSMSFEKGMIHALVGENGAGKSTLIKIISGAVQKDEGTVTIDGKQITDMSPSRLISVGVGVIYQEFNIIPSLSVTENIFLGDKIGGKVGPDFAKMREKAREIMLQLGVDIDVSRMVGDLSVAQQQTVEIAKWIYRNVKILIMDEPSAALSKVETENMLDLVRKLRDQGVTILYVSHRMEEIFAIADYISVMRDGCFIEKRPTPEMPRKEMISLMVGREFSETFPKEFRATDEVVLEVQNLSGNGDHDINFQLHKGEILGVAGLVGAGRTEMAKVIYGDAKKTGGSILLDGQEVRFRSPKDAIAHGIGLIPENRKEEGAFQEYRIDWNISVMALPQLSNAMCVVSGKKEAELAETYTNRLKIKTPSLRQFVKNLSGGNQQKVVLAKVLAANTKILIFDEPTRGIDVGAKQEIYQLMTDLVRQGVSILMISSELEELMGMSDRIIVLHQGRQTGILEAAQFDQKRILELASGEMEKLA